MREILFRGKRVGSGEWVVGTLVKMGPVGYVHHFILPDYASAFYDIEVDPATVGQYTGLTDKNDVKIFEGDILLTTNPNCKIWYVDYKPTAFCANQSNVNYSCILDEFVSSFETEVIGSIHDNPELLSKEDTKC